MPSTPSSVRTAARLVLGLALAGFGVAHLTVARKPFRAQVPKNLPGSADDIVLGSGIVEIGLGAAGCCGNSTAGRVGP